MLNGLFRAAKMKDASTPDLARSWAYARVSTEGQNPDLQIKALEAAGLDPKRIILDYESGTSSDRRGYIQIVRMIESGECKRLYTWRLDRLGRDQYDLVSLLQSCEIFKCEIISLCEPFVKDWNKSSWAFRATWDAIGDARYEWLRLRERQAAGIEAARAAGRHLGRPKKGGG